MCIYNALWILDSQKVRYFYSFIKGISTLCCVTFLSEGTETCFEVGVERFVRLSVSMSFLTACCFPAVLSV